MSQTAVSRILPVGLLSLAQTLVFVGLSITSFVIPFVLGHPQWLVGTIVNTALFLAVVFLPKKYYLPIIVLPSLAVLARGLIFGPSTMFLVYFIPFIWLSNLVLMLVFKKLSINLKYIYSIPLAAVVKFALLFLVANIYLGFSLVPGVFLQAMGVFQFLTALAGGAIALLIFSIYERRDSRHQGIN